MTGWHVRLSENGACVSYGQERGRSLYVDGAVLPESAVFLRSRRFPSAPHDVFVLADDLKSAEFIRSLKTKKKGAPSIHVCGKDRFLSVLADVEVFHIATKISALISLALASSNQSTPLATIDALEYLLKHEIASRLKPIFEIAHLTRSDNIQHIVLPLPNLCAALAISDILADRALAPHHPRQILEPASRLWRHYIPVPDAKIAFSGQGDTLAVLPLGRRKSQPTIVVSRITQILEDIGIPLIHVEEPRPKKRSWRESTTDLRAFQLLRACGVSMSISLLLAPSVARAISQRLPFLLALARTASQCCATNHVKSVITIQGLRMAGAFFAHGARAAGAGTLDVRPLIEGVSGRYSSHFFDAIVGFDPAQAALPRTAKSIFVARPLVEPSGSMSSFLGSTLIVSQPLGLEMKAIADRAAQGSFGRVRTRLHPSDGPAASALWQHYLPDAAIEPSGHDPNFTDTPLLVGATSNFIVEGALAGVPVLLATSEASLQAVWPQALRPGASLEAWRAAPDAPQKAADSYKACALHCPAFGEIIENWLGRPA